MRAAALLLTTLAACATACASKRTVVVVLLPDQEGTVGRAIVQNKAGSVDLASRWQGARVRGNRRPSLFTLSDPETRQMFGDAEAALPPAPQRFVLNFRFESDELTDEHPVADVVVIGHTDTMGSRPANFDLGLKRAVMVRNLLSGAGLDSARIEVSSLGETDLLGKTPDETPEPRNRRVDIVVR